MANLPAAQTTDFYCNKPENIREVRPFYLVMALVLTLIYGWSLYALPELRDPLRFFTFTVLMLAHGSLHWIGPNLTTRRHWLIPFFAVQGALAFTLTLIAPTQSALISLYLCLIGEAVGVLEKPFPSIVAIACYLSLSAINFGTLWGWDRLPQWFLSLAPSAFVVVVVVAMFVRQALARARAQALLQELEMAHGQLREYAVRVEELTRTNERQRLARDLHDTLAQGLAGVILQLEAIDASLGRGKTERAQSIVNQAMERARATLLDARQAIGNLRSIEFVSNDLAEAVRTEAARFGSASGTPCTLDVALSSRLPVEARDHALRALSEGLANVARHARANHVWIRVAQCDAQLEISVRDDGCGFDPDRVESHAGHYGLLGLRERAREAGGTLQITSAVGQGTTLALRMPIQDHRQGAG